MKTNKKGNLYLYDEADRLYDCQIKAISICTMRQEVVSVYVASRKIFHADSLYLYNILAECKKKTAEIMRLAE